MHSIAPTKSDSIQQYYFGLQMIQDKDQSAPMAVVLGGSNFRTAFGNYSFQKGFNLKLNFCQFLSKKFCAESMPYESLCSSSQSTR